MDDALDPNITLRGAIELDDESILGSSAGLNLCVACMIRIDHEGPVFRFEAALVECSHNVYIAFYAPTQALRRGVQEVWAVWTAGLPLVQSAMREHALGAVSKLQ